MKEHLKQGIVWDFTKSYEHPPQSFEDCIALKMEDPEAEMLQIVGFCSVLLTGNAVIDTKQARGVANELILLAKKYKELT